MSETNDQNSGPPISAASPIEAAASLDVPAVLANRFVLTVSNSGMRIAFAETQPGADLKFRSAVVLNFHDALSLANVLQEMISQHVVFGEVPPQEEA